MRLATKITAVFLRVLTIAFVFFADLQVRFQKIQIQSAAAQEAVRTGTGTQSKNSDLAKLTAEESQNGAVMSPYSACKGFIMVPHSEFQKPYWQERAAGKCDTKTANCQLKMQTIPDGKLFGAFEGKAGVNMSSVATATAFLDRVRQETEIRITKNIADREAVLKACRASATSASCQSYVNAAKKNLSKNEASFRNAIALLGDQRQSDLMRVIITGDGSALINRDLVRGQQMMQSMIEFPKMNRLSDVEFANAKKEVEEVLAKAKKEWAAEVEDTIQKRLKSGMPESQVEQARKNLMKEDAFITKFRQSILDMQAKKLKEYDRIFAESPESLYVGSSDAGVNEVLSGAAKIIDNLKKAKASMGQPLSPQDLQSEARIGEVLQYASFDAVISAMLEEENKKGQVSSCAVATAVQQRLGIIQDRNRLLAAGIGIGSLVVGGAVGLAGIVGKVGNVARAAGMGGMIGNGWLISQAGALAGLSGTLAYESSIKDELAVSSRAGLTDVQKVRDQIGVLGASVLLAPLDFMGTGAAVAGSALALKNANRIRNAVGDSTVGRFVTSAIATNALEKANANSAEVVRLLNTISATEEGSKESATAAKRLNQVINSTATAVLGRTKTANDERAMKAIASQYLGTTEKPLVSVFREYAETTKTMTGPELKAYADRLEEISKNTRGSEVSAAKPAVVDRELQEAHGQLAVQLAAEPGYTETAKVMTPGSGWTREAINNLREVVKSARALAKGSKEVLETRFKRVIAQLTGKSEDSAEVRQASCCAAVSLCSVAERYPDLEELQKETEPVMMACLGN